MYCPQCGAEAGDHFRFCSRCGHDLAPPRPAARRPAQDMAMHVSILAWLYIGSAILLALFGMVVLFAGQLVRYLPVTAPPDVPVPVAWLATTVALAVGFSIIVLAAGVAAAGIGLLQYRPWARVATLIAAVLFIFNFPIGTAIGIYAFWVLLSQEGKEHYQASAAVAET